MRLALLFLSALTAVYAQADDRAAVDRDPAKVCEGQNMMIERGGSTGEFEFSLKRSKGCGGADVKYRIVSTPETMTHRHTGKPGVLRGTPKIADATKPVGEYIRLSNPQFDNPKYGANEVSKKDVWPRHEDADAHEFLVQQGSDNWVEYKIPEFYKLRGIDLYETYNPGGVYRVDLLTEKSVHVVYNTKGKAEAAFETKATRVKAKDEGGNETGAQMLKLRFKEPKTQMLYLRVWVDASAKWRGIDAIMLSGLTKVFPHVPGELLDEKVTFTPRRDYGCDVLRYQVHRTEWSDSKMVKICYGAPRGRNGQVCSGNGKAKEGNCQCALRDGSKTEAMWQGKDCSTPKCPADGGKECGGRGTCGGKRDPQHNCVCHPAYVGRACRHQRQSAHCYFVGDPHWGTFDHRFTRSGTYYNNYFEGEFLDYYMDDPELNPDHEAIAHHQVKPWRHHYVTATQWVAFRKGRDFVRVRSTNHVEVGRAGSTCYGGNIASKVRALNKQGKLYETPDGLTIQWRGNHWRVASDVQGKNPSGTQLIVRGQWLYMNSYVHISTARIGKAVGMCGNFDGKGNDLGRHWRYGEPTAQVMNSLRVPASKSMGSCKGSRGKVVNTLLEDLISVQKVDLAEENAQVSKFVTHGDSDLKITAAMMKEAMSKSPVVAGAETAQGGAQVEAAKVEPGEARKVAGESLHGALRDCADRTADTRLNPKLPKPHTRTHLALRSCFDTILVNTPAGEVSAELSDAARREEASARKALQVIAPFMQHSEAVNNYISCITDVCESGVTEDWTQVEEEEKKLDEREDLQDDNAILETERIEGHKL